MIQKRGNWYFKVERRKTRRGFVASCVRDINNFNDSIAGLDMRQEFHFAVGDTPDDAIKNLQNSVR